MPVPADVVGREALVALGEVEVQLGRSARPRDAALGVDDDARPLDQVLGDQAAPGPGCSSTCSSPGWRSARPAGSGRGTARAGRRPPSRRPVGVGVRRGRTSRHRPAGRSADSRRSGRSPARRAARRAGTTAMLAVCGRARNANRRALGDPVGVERLAGQVDPLGSGWDAARRAAGASSCREVATVILTPGWFEQDPDQLARRVARRPHDRHAHLTAHDMLLLLDSEYAATSARVETPERARPPPRSPAPRRRRGPRIPGARSSGPGREPGPAASLPPSACGGRSGGSRGVSRSTLTRRSSVPRHWGSASWVTMTQPGPSASTAHSSRSGRSQVRGRAAGPGRRGASSGSEIAGPRIQHGGAD